MASVPYMYIGLCTAVYSLCTDFLSAGTSNDFACLASVSSLYLGLLVFYLIDFSATVYGLPGHMISVPLFYSQVHPRRVYGFSTAVL